MLCKRLNWTKLIEKNKDFQHATSMQAQLKQRNDMMLGGFM